MPHHEIYSQLKEFHQGRKFTLLKNHVNSLEILSASQVFQEKLFLTHLEEAAQLLLQLVNAVGDQSLLSSIQVTMKEYVKDSTQMKQKIQTS